MSAEETQKRQKAWLAGGAGLTAVATLVGASARRSMADRARGAEDPYAGEDFDRLDCDRSLVVTTADGVPLAVRESGPEDAPLTLVFAHGFCLRMGAFHFQRMRLGEQWGPRVRMVFYDQRGHGQSGEAAPETYNLTQLGQDLEAVLRARVPRGPIVLVGHSMGGMTVLSHARQFPDQYGRRIVGVALISTAAEGDPLAVGRGADQSGDEGGAFRRAVGPPAVASRAQGISGADRPDPAGRVLQRPGGQSHPGRVLPAHDEQHSDRDDGRFPAGPRGTRRDGRAVDVAEGAGSGGLR
ncbi:hypothetical protein IWGMT90018_11150 [Mycobacterium kiyosense]|nr:hypothetical protein IWGMT90018_11150 [Mycobacterium kiyosense]